MRKEALLFGRTKDSSGNSQTYISECFVRFIQEKAIGTRPEKMGLSSGDALKILRFLKKNGVDVPLDNKDWGATPVQRQIVSALGDGNVTQKQAAEALGISGEHIRTELSIMRKNNYNFPNPPRANREPRPTLA